MKKKILLVAAVAICCALAVSGTLAFYTVEGTAHNVITSGNIAIELLETGADGGAYPSGPVAVVPGQSVTKTVTVKNTGGNDAFVRVKVDTTVTKGSDTAPVAGDTVALNFNATQWTKGTDGYYYYKEALKPGDTTAALFDTVTFNGEAIGNNFSDSQIDVTVSAHGVQAANNGEDPLAAQGWPNT